MFDPRRRKFLTDEDWMEWQANFMSACLLMPKKTFVMAAYKIFKGAGIKEKYIEIGKNRYLDKFSNYIPVEMSNIFNVSIQAASIRLRELKLIRENLAQSVVN
jgi:Zn-dependent peptidase ImmA (M78 family)